MAGRKPRHLVLVASDVPYSRMLLKQTLQQHECDVRVASSVPEALQALRRERLQTVVIDLANPPGTSEQLLLQIRVAGNQVPMLLLLHNLDRDLLRRLNNLRPVGFLSKPLKVETLSTLLPLALSGDAQLLLESARLARIGGKREVGAGRGGRGGANSEVELADTGGGGVDESRLKRMFGSLPLLPHVLSLILQLSSKETTTAQELADAIRGDPRLSGQLLRIVNSAYFGFSRRVSTIPEATVILGIQAIRNLAVGASVSGFFGGESDLVDRTQLWRHSLAVGIGARKIAQLAGSSKAEEAFTAGLLHDFGRLCLERYLGESYRQALEQAREHNLPLVQTEEEAIGVTHAWVGGWLASQWNLPAVLTEALKFHHQPESAHETARETASAVNVGNVVCHLAGLGGILDVVPTIEPSAYSLGILNLSLERAVAVTPEIVSETSDLEEQLSAVVGQEH